MNRMKHPLLIRILPLIVLAACGTEETPTPGGIAAQVDCAAMDDSLLVTVYMTGEEVAAASQWCSCGGGTCSAEFSGLGHGDYVLGVGRPDTTYRSTEGAEGFSQTLGYYSDMGLVDDSEEATTITLSEEQPTANVNVNLAREGEAAYGDSLMVGDTTATMPGE